MDISLVVPVYNEEESLGELHEWICRVTKANNLSFELIMVDDGSSDNSWSVIESLSSKDDRVKGYSFARNYGKSAALYVGFEAAQGDVVITMDADLQDSPDEIPELYRMVKKEGYDLVSGWKRKRFDPLGKTLPSKLFNRTARIFSGIKLHDFNCGLKAYRLKVVKSIEVYGEMHRYIPILASKAGYKKIGEKEVEHQARKYGYSKYGWERMIKGYLDLLTVLFMTSFGRSPMYLFGALGTLTFLAGGAITSYIIAQKLMLQAAGQTARAVTDQPLFFLALIALVVGVQLFLSGFIGEMIIRNSASRNSYKIDKTV